MPARIVDGDALWRSDKLSQVEPPKFRAEYANMIPLALADGTFECNPRRVWSDIYSYNRPDVQVSDVELILNEFERVGLLRRQTDENGKVWGFWIGIEKRLPSESTRDRYKKGGSRLFDESITTTSRQHHDDVIPRLDRIGFSKDLDLDKNGSGDFKVIRSRWYSYFKKDLSRSKQNREQYSKACAEFGEEWILDQLEKWQENNQWVAEHPRGDNRLYIFLETLPVIHEGGRLAREREEQQKVQNEQSQVANHLMEQSLEKAKAESIRERDERLERIRLDDEAAERLKDDPLGGLN